MKIYIRRRKLCFPAYTQTKSHGFLLLFEIANINGSNKKITTQTQIYMELNICIGQLHE